MRTNRHIEINRMLRIGICLFGVWIFGVTSDVSAQSTTQNVQFKVTTSSPGGNFSPRNIGAIWIEDASGNFVRTVQVWADRRKQYLYTWNTRTGGNTTDAITGATLSSHQTHEVSWDVKDTNMNSVPNGSYVLKVEMTDQHSQGPLVSFDFPVGEATNTLTFSDTTNYHDIELSWASTTTEIDNNETGRFGYELSQNYPNPFNPTTEIKFSVPHNSEIDLSIYNSFGQKLTTLVNEYKQAGAYSVEFNASEFPSGLYFYKITTRDFTQTKKMLLIQ